MILVVQGIDGRKGISVRRHLNEAEAATPTCLAILDHLSASHFAKRREQVLQVGTRYRESKITDVQLLAHLFEPPRTCVQNAFLTRSSREQRLRLV
jgi:hypothetical protein